MPKRYKEARLMHKAKLTEMATKLGVSQPTLSAWESERKSAPVEAVIKMATLYGVTTDYLLGLMLQRGFFRSYRSSYVLTCPPFGLSKKPLESVAFLY